MRAGPVLSSASDGGLYTAPSLLHNGGRGWVRGAREHPEGSSDDGVHTAPAALRDGGGVGVRGAVSTL